MDVVNSKVIIIKSALQGFSRQLQIYEDEAQKSIGSEAGQMQNALGNVDHKIQFLSSEAQSFLTSIEDKEPQSVDLTPQMKWLSTSLADIASDFQEAESHADLALNHTINYQYQVSNVGQDVGSQESKLDAAQEEGVRVTQRIQFELSESEDRMSIAQSKSEEKREQLRSKSARVASLRAQKSGYEQTIREKQSAINRANAKAESKKEKGTGVAIGASLLGIGLAPFTGGASLGLLAVGAGVGIGTAVAVDDLRVEASNARAAVARLESQISSEQKEVAALEREKTQLEEVVKKQEAEVRKQKARQVEHQAQIRISTKVQSEIETLKQRAESTRTNAQDVWTELQSAKVVLDECSAAINAQTSQSQATYKFTDLFFGASYRRKMVFQRQKEILKRVVQNLDEMNKKAPKLQGNNSKFLDLKPWNSVAISVTEAGTPIPEIQFQSI